MRKRSFLYGAVAATYLVSQIVLARKDRTAKYAKNGIQCSIPSPWTRDITVIVPAYNEDLKMLDDCLASLKDQDVIVVDDGSEVLVVDSKTNSARIVRIPHGGKRSAQAAAMEHTDAEIFITVDSDTVIEPGAIEKLIRVFDDPKVAAATGNSRALNWNENLLTRIIDGRYWQAFNQERAAQSAFGSVSCMCGAFSAYRADVFRAVLPEYLAQTFLGQPCSFGDDRHLTNLILNKGWDCVYVHDACARTMVPSDLQTYAKQQVRWARSYYRESLWAFKRGWYGRRYLALDQTVRLLLQIAMLVGLARRRGRPRLGLAITLAGLRGVHGLVSTREIHMMSFALYGLLHLGVVLPSSIWAILTPREIGWGTR